MLVLYLPIIILEAMFDVRKLEREPSTMSRPEHQDEGHASALGKASR